MRNASPHSPDAESASGAQPGSPGGRRIGAAKNPLRWVRATLLVLLLLLAAAVTYALVQNSKRPPSPPLATLETAAGVAQRAINLDATRTRRGLPSLKVSAKEAFTYNEGKTELHDVAVTIFGESHEHTEILAPLATSGEGSAGAWSFRNGVELRADDGVKLRVPELKYRERPGDVSAAGDVAFDRGTISGTAVGLRYLVYRRRLDLLSKVKIVDSAEGSPLRKIDAATASLEPDVPKITFHNYRAGMETGETLEGGELTLLFEPHDKGDRIQRIEATGGFSSSAPGGDPNAPRGFLGSGAASLGGDSLTIPFLDDGRIQQIQVNGNARASMVEKEGSARHLNAGRMTIDIDASGKASKIVAEGGARFDAPSTGGEGGGTAVLRAESIETALQPDGSAISKLTAEGNATVEDGDRHLKAATMIYDAASDSWRLEGDPAAPAWAAAGDMTVSAARIDMHRKDRSLEASGDVKSLATPKEAGPSRPAQPAGAGHREPSVPKTAPTEPPAKDGFLGGTGPVHGMSQQLTVTDGGKRASYRGNVRLWREGTSVEAEQVDLDQDAGTMEARIGVVARVPAKRASDPAPQTITISSSKMVYDRNTQEASFTGGARAVASDMRIDCGSLLVRGSDSGGVRSMVARQSVKLAQGTRQGDCDELDADFPEDKYVLYGHGRLATIQDKSSQQVAKGTVLTFEGSTDKILVESETGGRTWVTLAPRPGLGKKGDPESPR